MDSVYATLIDYGLNEVAAKYLNYFILMVVILAVSITITLIIYKVVLKFLFKRIKNNKYNWDDILFKNRVFHKIVMIIPGITTYNSAVFFDEFSVVVSKLSMIYILFTVILMGRALIKSVEDIYRQFSISKDRPIKGFLQVIEIILYIVLIIMIISIMVDKSPVALISGIGALTALTTLIFKDSIVGFVAGMQLTWNDMLRIGDWIEMPKYGADGDVIDITLNTVKIQNFDKTIVTIPTYALISDSFKNWRGMQEMGARRIKRSINIDITSIKFCTNEMLDKYKKINILKDYIKNKEIELKDSNEKTENMDLLINGRNLTNVGVFRIYVQNYISNHPKIHNGMTLMVRQLVPGDNGLPLEIYAFINDIDWVNYENIQSDIFDHLFAVAEFFELRIFQKPSSYDFNNAILNERKI
ncbi:MULTISPECIES: mechanosensitive ion channel family protein [unclassified Sedimentibacter]|uniref:mechanosensitive ion channel family protein n=1 Tax=unclassified Sedimentibacter TaxID=2649220 RepID=UPI0027DEBC58|nr:mechanosensitive ion channel domain-containing protein [Sedimentibacter sp. MB35-C1]WMJ78765.1 mechanosensitive ion channel [Sedimentibacter sp. MB35-C1]